MSDWFHSLRVAWMALLVFGFTYFLVAVIYAVIRRPLIPPPTPYEQRDVWLVAVDRSIGQRRGAWIARAGFGYPHLNAGESPSQHGSAGRG